MVNGISDNLNVQQRSQNLVAATSDRHQSKAAKPAQLTAIPSHRLESYARWARVTQGQHKISAFQVAEQGLKQIFHLLKQLKRLAQSTISLSGESRNTQIKAATSLQLRLSQLRVEYQNRPLLDHQLNLISKQRPPAPRQFVLRSIELAQPKPRDERIQIQSDKDSISILLPANASKAALIGHLSEGMHHLEITIPAPHSETTVFHCNDDRWQKIKAGIMMTGKGQRLPAGEARTIKVEEILTWQDPREWRLASNEDLKQTVVKINKSLFKLEQQLRELTQTANKIQRQLHKANKENDFDDELKKTLNSLERLMQSTPFALQMTSVMAQANVTRSQVSSLLL